MLNEHTLNQLRSLRLDGMVRAIEEQATSTAAASLSFDERLTLLVQREVAWRDDRRVQRLLKAAKLKVSSACIEDINWRASRALDRGLISTLAGADWLRHARNLLITGATGSGKTWLACALAHQAARSGFSVLYVRAARLFDELQVAHGDGSFARRLAQLAKLDYLVERLSNTPAARVRIDLSYGRNVPVRIDPPEPAAPAGARRATPAPVPAARPFFSILPSATTQRTSP